MKRLIRETVVPNTYKLLEEDSSRLFLCLCLLWNKTDNMELDLSMAGINVVNNMMGL